MTCDTWVTTKASEVAPVRPELVADRWYVPASATVRSLKVARPATANWECVPPKVADGLRATSTAAVLVVRLPYASSMRTVTAGVIAARAAVLLGWTPNRTWWAAAGSTWMSVCVPVREALAMSVAVIDCRPAVYSVPNRSFTPASCAVKVTCCGR